MTRITILFLLFSSADLAGPQLRAFGAVRIGDAWVYFGWQGKVVLKRTASQRQMSAVNSDVSTEVAKANVEAPVLLSALSRNYPGTSWELSGILQDEPAYPAWPGLALLAGLAGLAWLACLPGRLLMISCTDFENMPTPLSFLYIKPIGFNNCWWLTVLVWRNANSLCRFCM